MHRIYANGSKLYNHNFFFIKPLASYKADHPLLDIIFIGTQLQQILLKVVWK